jgi:hypothetical protein
MRNTSTTWFWTSVGITFVGALSGCDSCGKLDERMCADLGAEDCALWKESGMSFTDQAEQSPGGGRRSGLKRMLFGSGSDVCNAASNDAAYEQILTGTKQAVAGMRAAKKAQAAAGIK